MLEDYRTAPISESEKALLALIAKMNADTTTVGQADVDATKAAGWSDEAIYDAITVCALFRFYNAWVDAAGVHEMDGSAYETMGTRLAKFGYAPWAEPKAD